MSTNIKHYLHETGSDVILDCGEDIGGAVLAYVYYKKPNATLAGSWVGALYSSYSTILKATGNYLVKYTLAYADLDTAGQWKLQAFVATAAGTWFGETVELDVYNTFE